MRTLFALVVLSLGQPLLGQETARWEELNRRVIHLYNHRNYAEAEPLSVKSLSIAEREFGPKDPRLATSLGNLALVYLAQRKLDQAQAMAQRALQILEELLGPDQPGIAGALNNLAMIYLEEGKYSKAEALCLRARSIQEKSLPPDAPELALTLHNLGFIYHQQRKSGDEELYKRSLAIAEKAYGPNDPRLARVAQDLALDYQISGRLADALPLYCKVLALDEAVLGTHHPDVLADRYAVAYTQEALGQLAEAVQTFRRIRITEERKTDKERASDLSRVDEKLSELQLLQGHDREAEASAIRAVRVLDTAHAPPDQGLQPLRHLAEMYRDRKNYALAEKEYNRLQAEIRKRFSPGFDTDMRIATVRDELIRLAENQGNSAAAASYYRAQLETWERYQRNDDGWQQTLAALLRKASRNEEAAAIEERLREKHFPEFVAGLKVSDLAGMKYMLVLQENAALEKGFGTEYSKVADGLAEYARILRLRGYTGEANDIDARVNSMREHLDYSGPNSYVDWLLLEQAQAIEEDIKQDPSEEARIKQLQPYRASQLEKSARLLRQVNRVTEAQRLEENANVLRKGDDTWLQGYAVLVKQRRDEDAAVEKAYQDKRFADYVAGLKEVQLANLRLSLLSQEQTALEHGFNAAYSQTADELAKYAAILRMKGHIDEAKDLEARVNCMREHSDYAGANSFVDWLLLDKELALKSALGDPPSNELVAKNWESFRESFALELETLAGLLRKVNRATEAGKLEGRAKAIRSSIAVTKP